MAELLILITGGAGFIGSNFINYVLKRNNKLKVLNLDKLTYAGNLLNLKNVEKNQRHKFLKGDITNKKLIDFVFEKNRPDIVINFAAESHVDRSILDPNQFIKTNITGTQFLLEASRKYGVDKFIQISTDEVYGSIDKGKSNENDALKPNSPYSASKAAADLLCRSYYKTYHVPVIVTRSSNNYGPYQFPEKLIPLMINNIIDSKQLPVYAEGKNMRDWIYVEDNCRAIYQILQKGKAGEVFNIGVGSAERNIDIINNICKIMSDKITKPIDEIKSLITYVEDRPGHDFRYCLNNSKIQSETGWKPNLSLKDGLRKTVNWYLLNKNWVSSVRDASYKNIRSSHRTEL